MTAPYLAYEKDAVSIITCTKRRQNMDTLFQNYARQNYKNKELIVILNHPSLKLSDYIRAASPYPNVRIYSLPGHVSLGSCLNFGVKMAKYGLIAKFDDDDYYASNYLSGSRRSMVDTHADIVGKRAHFMYLNGKKLLLLRYPKRADQYVSLVQGATLLIKREVLEQVEFPDLNRNECVKFCSICLSKGFKIYAGSPYNFLAIRRRNSKDHTWMISDTSLLKGNAKVLKVRDVKEYICR